MLFISLLILEVCICPFPCTARVVALDAGVHAVFFVRRCKALWVWFVLSLVFLVYCSWVLVDLFAILQ